MQQATQHFPMISHGGGSQMSEGIGEVAVDEVWGKFPGQPWKPANKDLQLLKVSRAPTDPVVVEPSQLQQRHGVCPAREGRSTHADHFFNSPENRYIRFLRAASSVGYLPVLTAQLRRVDPILRASYLALLAACLWAHRWELAIGLLVAGQFGEALKEFRPRTG
jgi:hypothetical protein